MRNSIECWRITFIDGIGPEGAGKGTVMLMPFSWISERVSAEILAFAEKTLGVTSGGTYMYPAVTPMTSNASVYTNDGQIAASVSFKKDYNTGAPKELEVMTAAQYLETLAPQPVRSVLQQYTGRGWSAT